MGISAATAKVLICFLDDPAEPQYGFGLMRSTGVKSGSLYPILERLERIGWVESTEEDIDERAEGRPRRRLYRLTAEGERDGRMALAEFFRPLKRPGWLTGFEGA